MRALALKTPEAVTRPFTASQMRSGPSPAPPRPRLACARAIYRVGISTVVTRAGPYPIGEDAGRVFLSAYGVRIYYVASL